MSNGIQHVKNKYTVNFDRSLWNVTKFLLEIRVLNETDGALVSIPFSVDGRDFLTEWDCSALIFFFFIYTANEKLPSQKNVIGNGRAFFFLYIIVTQLFERFSSYMLQITFSLFSVIFTHLSVNNSRSAISFVEYYLLSLNQIVIIILSIASLRDTSLHLPNNSWESWNNFNTSLSTQYVFLNKMLLFYPMF